MKVVEEFMKAFIQQLDLADPSDPVLLDDLQTATIYLSGAVRHKAQHYRAIVVGNLGMAKHYDETVDRELDRARNSFIRAFNIYTRSEKVQ